MVVERKDTLCVLPTLKSPDSGHVNQLLVGSQIIFAHPESLLEDKCVFHGLLKSDQLKNILKAIVVDEAHLILEW